MVPDEVTTAIGEHYELQGVELSPIDGGADLAASLWKAVDSRGRRFAVKWSGSGSPAGMVLPAALDAIRAGSAPAPVPTRGRSLWVDVGDARLSVTRWADGESAWDTPLGRPGWYAFGQLLSALHSLPVVGQVSKRVPREDFDPSRWGDYFEKIDAELDGAPFAGVTARLAELWHAHRPALREVHRRTLDLGARLRTRADLPRYVPCHADPHLGNIVVSEDGRPVLLDFDDAVLAPTERDLMFVLGGGVLADAPVTGRQQAWFLEGYGAYSVDPDLLTYYRGLRVLEDVSEPAGVVLDPAGSDGDRREALGLVEGVFSDTGLLAQARAVVARR